jgi:PAS domain-containing protein
MSSAPSDVRNRITSALQRASGLEEKLRPDRIDPEALSSPVVTRIVAEVRRLARELHLSFEDLAQAIVEQTQAKEAASIAQRQASTVFRLSPTPCIITDASGAVVDINAAASQLLNVTSRHVVGRPFLLFLGSDRLMFLNLLSQTRHGEDVQRCEVHIRPRERAPFDATALIAPDTSDQILLMLLPPRAERPAGDAGPIPLDLFDGTFNLKSRRRRLARAGAGGDTAQIASS